MAEQMTGKYHSFKTFEEMTPQEQIAHNAEMQAQLEKAQQSALGRLPEFDTDEKDKQIIHAYRFIRGLVQIKSNTIRSAVFAEVLTDLRTAYPEVLTYDQLNTMYEEFDTSKSINTPRL